MAPVPAVRVCNGGKNFGKSVILQGLDMTVPPGVTYALLGSSGCGKTTLLSTIVGLQKLGSGSVQIFGQGVSKTERMVIGYMPQESGLHAELTISEELHFFGRLYGLDWHSVEDRIQSLLHLLQLPGENCLIQNLSGGETRRVSLALALLHKPRLLILDEATTGVDPLLRQSIWEHLYKLVKEDGTTIICSTHYTEEARQADVVSVMRNGRLLVEDDPHSLLTKFGATLLEDVVLELCHSQELQQASINNDMNSWNYVDTSGWEGNIMNISYKRRPSKDDLLDVIQQPNNINCIPQSHTPFYKTGSRLKNNLARHSQSMYAMLLLNAIMFVRNPIMLLVILTFPASLGFFSWVIHGPPHPHVGVVNLEQPDCFNLPPLEHKLGCQLTSYLIQDDKMKLESFLSEESAMTALDRGDITSFLVLPGNFTTNSAQRLAFGRYADNETIQGSSIPIYVDYANYILNLFLFAGLDAGYQDFTRKKLSEEGACDWNLVLNSLSPFKVNEKLGKLIPGETNHHDNAAMMYITCYILIMPSVIAVSIVLDKKRGVFQRTLLGGGGLPHLLIASIIAYGLVYLGQIGLVILVFKILRVPFEGCIMDVVILNYGQSLVGLTFGILIGLILHQELEVVFVILAFLMINNTSGGGMTSLESLNIWVKWFVISLPSKLPSVGLEHILFKGWTIFNPGMLPCFYVQGAWITLCIFCTAVMYYRVHFY